ncbi:MAG: hypothetical protein HY791_06915 [Deltaproteobacteria bacterium]|nr:hypothetical protein [Deltaproteobacteria bacterium]
MRLELLVCAGFWLSCADDPTRSSPDAGPKHSDPVDPLSMPAEPTVSPASFKSSEECQACHPTHFAEWRSSMHAYSMVDPLFRALVAIRSADFDGARDAFCIQCHSAIATRGGEVKPKFSFESLSAIALEGVTCEACHKVSSVARLYNSGHVLDPAGAMRGPLEVPSEASMHPAEYSEDFEKSEFCAGCHNVIEFTSVPLERPFDEWLTSPSNLSGETCQSCHMPEKEGRASAIGPPRTIHDHRFVGVDVPLTEGFMPEETREDLKDRVAGLLGGAAELRLTVPERVPVGRQLDVVVEVENLVRGHNLPTGSTFHRQCWVELRVEDSSGVELYSTGALDPNGDLKDHFSELEPYADHDLIRFGSRFVDDRGNPTLFPWLAAEHISSTIPPGYSRSRSLFVKTSSASRGRATVEARLLFRAVPPFLLRALGLGAQAERLDVYEVATASVALTLE